MSNDAWDMLARKRIGNNLLDQQRRLKRQQDAMLRADLEVDEVEDLTTEAGTAYTGELLYGNDRAPGDGFAGLRAGYPGFEYGVDDVLKTFLLVGVHDDYARNGFTDEGEIVAQKGLIATFTLDGPDLTGGAGPAAFGLSSDPVKPLLWGGGEAPATASLQIWKSGLGYLGTGATRITLDGPNGKISLGDSGSPGLHIDGVNQRIYSDDYSAGQKGFLISAPYGGRSFMEIDDLRARGEIHSAVFVAGETQVKAGSQVIAPSSGKLHNDIDLASVTSIDITDSPGGHIPSFSAGDAVRIKTTGIDVWFEIDSIDDTPSGYFTYGVTHKSGSTSGMVYAGAAVTDYKQAGSGVILQTADEVDGPYIAVQINEEGTPWAGLTNNVRIGNLAGIWGGMISGYGLAMGNDLGAVTPTGTVLCTQPITLTGVSGSPKASIAGFDNEGDAQVYWNSEDGSIGFGNGNGMLDKDGVTLLHPTSYSDINSYKIKDGSIVTASFDAYGGASHGYAEVWGYGSRMNDMLVRARANTHESYLELHTEDLQPLSGCDPINSYAKISIFNCYYEMKSDPSTGWNHEFKGNVFVKGKVITEDSLTIGTDAGANARQIFNSKAMGVRVIRTAAQTLTQTQYTPLEWNLQTDTYSHGANQSDDTSPNNDMWTGTYPTRLYARYAGWYMGGGGLEFNQSAGTEPGIGIRVVLNDSIILAQERYKEVAAGFPPALSISTGMFYMHAGDYITVEAYTGTSNQNTAQAASLAEHYKNFGFLVRIP